MDSGAQEQLIFVSYRSRDWAFAHRLYERLEAGFGGEVYIDRRISSDNYETELLGKVRVCDIFVLVVTSHTFDSDRLAHDDDWIRREVSLALALDKRIVLVLYEGIRPPPTDDLPEEIRGITSRQGVKFYPEYFDQAVVDLQQQCKSIAPSLVWSTAAPARRRPSPSETTRERRLEAAMPREVSEGSSTEVRVKVSRIDSKGLRGELPARLASGDEIKKSDTRQTTFPMTFPTDDDGRLLPALLCVRVDAEHYDVDFVTYPDSFCGKLAELELLPELDSRTVVFSLTPTPTAPSVGRSRVAVRVFYGRRILAEIALGTERVAYVPELTYVLGSGSLEIVAPDRYGDIVPAGAGTSVATLPPPPMEAPRPAPPQSSWSPPPYPAQRPPPPGRASARSRSMLVASLLLIAVAIVAVILFLVL